MVVVGAFPWTAMASGIMVLPLQPQVEPCYRQYMLASPEAADKYIRVNLLRLRFRDSVCRMQVGRCRGMVHSRSETRSHHPFATHT